MAKNNIRSIRFSDELADLIDQQIGDTFTQKFESLIYRAFWELPAKEKELEEIKEQIVHEKQRLSRIQVAARQIFALERSIENLRHQFNRIEQEAKNIAEEVEKAET